MLRGSVHPLKCGNPISSELACLQIAYIQLGEASPHMLLWTRQPGGKRVIKKVTSAEPHGSADSLDIAATECANRGLVYFFCALAGR